MPLSPSKKPKTASGAFRSFWFRLLDLPEDDQVQRLINSQLITSAASPSTISNSQAYLRYQQQQYQGQASSSILINNNQINPTTSNIINNSRYSINSRNNKTAEQLAPKTSTGEVQFANSNQNSVYCVSSVNLSRLAFEEQSAGRASSSAAAVPLVVGGTPGAVPPTPTQLTIATELPTATKFTTRTASFIDKPQRPRHIMHKKDFFDLKSYEEYEGMAVCAVLLTILSIILIGCSLPFSLFFCIKVVQEYERAVIFRLGRLVTGGARGPGIFFIIPCIDTYSKVDLRTVSFDVPPQEILSKDSVTVAVDAVVYFRINNAIASVSNVEDYARSTRLLAATTLRNVLGTKNLSEILSERESISHMIQSSLDEATESWGVKVERVEIKDVRLPVQLQRAMAAEAEATREARAKVIAAEGEQRASRALKEAASVISDSPAALQLRYLQTLSSIAAENNSTIVFPVPMELFRGFIHDDYHEDENGHEKHHHHHSSHHHSSHHHDQHSDCEDCDKHTNCVGGEFNQYETNGNQTNCQIQQILSSELNHLANFNADEYLQTDLESPVPKYKE